VDLPTPPFRIPGISGATDRPGFVIAGVPVGTALEFPINDQITERSIWLGRAKLLMEDPRANIEGPN
jgi:hypothetical protein